MKKTNSEIAHLLREGGTILYPTDTIWGVGCDATNTEAVEKVMQIKKRPPSKSMVCLMSDDAMLNRYITEVTEVAWDLFDSAEKPLTLILPNARGLAQNAIAEDNSVAIRMIRKGPLHQLIYNLKRPLVSTSANLSGQPSPKNYNNIAQEIKTGVDHIVEFDEQVMTGHASSIIKLELNGEVKIIRP